MNALEGVFDNPVVVKLGLALVHFLWQGTVIALVVALVLACLRKATANSRYLVLLAALALMGAAPVATSLLMSAAPRQAERGVSVGPTPRPASSMPQVPVPSTTAALAYPEAADAAPGSKPAAHASRLYASLLLARLDDLVPWAVVLWMTGVLVLSLRLIGRWRAVERAKRRAVQLAGDRWRQTVAELSQRLSISRSVRVLESAVIRIPTVLGWLRPVILLPATALTGLTPEQWQAILAHELAHVRRNDYLVNLTQTVVETLLFYHPAVWWLSSRIRTEREHCCDDLAVAACGDAVVYMRALAALEQRRGALRPALGADGGSLVKRVRRLAEVSSSRSDHISAWLAGAAALMVVAAVAIGVQAGGVAAGTSRYDHFLFVRTDNIEEQPGGTDTLVMAKVTPEGFELRDFHSKNNLGVGLKYLGVFGGQAYLMKIDQLYRLDLATGRFSPVTERLQLHDYVDGRLFTVEGGGAIREYDLRAGAYREVTTIPNVGHCRLRASPDGRRLAFFTQVASDAYGYADQLNVIDVATGTVSTVGSPIRFAQFAVSSTLMNGPPFVWLNGREILLVQTEGQVRWEAPTRTVHILGDQVDHLAVMSVDTGKVRDVTVIPGQPSVRGVEIEMPDLVSLPVLLLSDAGVGRARYLVDPRAGKLVESDGIGGGFHLRVTVRPNGETYHQLYHGTKLLVAEKGYESVRVSPDGRRAIWAGDRPLKLKYYDSQVGQVRPVAEIWSLDSQESLLWFSGEDLRPAPPIRPAPGWREMREPAEPSEALRPDWGPKRVSQRFAGTAQVVHRFVSRMSYSSGRDPEAERELLAQGRTRAQADLRALLRELPPSDRFRFMVAFTMYWMGLDPQSSRAVMLEYCPPGNKPGYEEYIIIFLDYAYRKRPDRRLLEGILGWVPQSDGAGAEALASILPDKARSHPRDLLSALKGKPSLLWRRAANLLFDREAESPARAYPELATIADRRNDTLNGLATRLLGEMASSWPVERKQVPSIKPTVGTPGASATTPQEEVLSAYFYALSMAGSPTYFGSFAEPNAWRTAYDYLSPAAKKRVPPEKFRQTLKGLGTIRLLRVLPASSSEEAGRAQKLRCFVEIEELQESGSTPSVESVFSYSWGFYALTRDGGTYRIDSWDMKPEDFISPLGGHQPWRYDPAARAQQYAYEKAQFKGPAPSPAVVIERKPDFAIVRVGKGTTELTMRLARVKSGEWIPLDAAATYPSPPEGLSRQEQQIWRLLVRPEDRRVAPGTICEPYNIRVVGRWAAAKIHPLNTVTDDALVLLERRPAGWTILILGTDIPASGRDYGIPAEARKKLGLPF